MKTARTALTTAALVLTTVPALAETAARTDHSGILVWAFLGLCALIVIGQAMPAAMMMVGMVKGLLAKVEPEIR